MTATTKKSPTTKKAASATPAEPPRVEFAPETFMPLPAPRDNDALARALREQSAFADGEINKNDGHAAAVAVVESLNDDDYAALWRWVRAVTWVFSGTDDAGALPAVRRGDLAVPAVFSARVDPEVDGAEAVIDHYSPRTIQLVQVVDDAPQEAPSVIEEAVQKTTEIVAAIVDESLQAPTPTPETDGQLPLVTEPEKPGKAIKAMSFRGPDEVVCVNRALNARLADLEAEAKRLDTLGKPDAAKLCRDEVLLIKRQLLPQVTAQMALPFNEREALPSLVGRMVSGEVRARARAALFKNIAPKKGESRQDAEDRQREQLDDFEQLIGGIGEQVGAIVTRLLDAVADRGIEAGKRALSIESGHVAREALQLVEAELQSARKDAA